MIIKIEDRKQLYCMPVKGAIKHIFNSFDMQDLDFSPTDYHSAYRAFTDRIDNTYKVSGKKEELIQTHITFETKHDEAMLKCFGLADLRDTSVMRLGKALNKHQVDEEVVPYLPLLNCLVDSLTQKRNLLKQEHDKVMSLASLEFSRVDMHNLLQGRKDTLWQNYLFQVLGGNDQMTVIQVLINQFQMLNPEIMSYAEQNQLMAGFDWNSPSETSVFNSIDEALQKWERNYDMNCIKFLDLQEINYEDSNENMIDPMTLQQEIIKGSYDNQLFKMGAFEDYNFEFNS